jgi:hypothetical protein
MDEQLHVFALFNEITLCPAGLLEGCPVLLVYVG